MFSKFTKRLVAPPPPAAPIEVFRDDITQEYHGIRHADLSPGSLRVIETLQNAGFQAYLVGGGIRDLLLDKHPKDFDVATNATPAQIEALFKRARAVGRRFQIVHVRMGPEIVEVTTFRGRSEDSHHQQTNAQGMLVRDNVFGTVEDDAVRRDFTMNALYYDPKTHHVIDFVGWYDDLEDHIIRIICDPATRYREDPVWMLRAARFVGKLKLNLDPATAAPIRQLAGLLRDVSASRLFYEVLKLLQAGYGRATYHCLREYGLFGQLFPETETLLSRGDDPHYARLIDIALTNTDARLNAGKSVTPAFLYAAIYWPSVHQRWQEREAEGNPRAQALAIAGSETIDRNQAYVAIPKRFTQGIREIWELQAKLERRDGRRPDSTLSHPRFRAGYDFLLLREESGELPPGLGTWWTAYQVADDAKRRALIAEVREHPPEHTEDAATKPRRRRRPNARPRED